jgi:PleD family two-component response regulator
MIPGLADKCRSNGTAVMSKQAANSRGGRRLIVIDGEPTVRSVVRQILEREGYVVDATGDLKAALELCRSTLGRI